MGVVLANQILAAIIALAAMAGWQKTSGQKSFLSMHAYFAYAIDIAVRAGKLSQCKVNTTGPVVARLVDISFLALAVRSAA